MVVDPRGSSLPFVWVCLDCGHRYGGDENGGVAGSDGLANCPQCGGPLRQQHRI
jgi:rubrerythrin